MKNLNKLQKNGKMMKNGGKKGFIKEVCVCVRYKLNLLLLKVFLVHNSGDFKEGTKKENFKNLPL